MDGAREGGFYWIVVATKDGPAWVVAEYDRRYGWALCGEDLGLIRDLRHIFQVGPRIQPAQQRALSIAKMRLRKGQIVKVEFLDHCCGDSKPMACVVYGEIGQIGRVHICVDSWAYADKSARHDPDNEDRKAILRSTITKITRLVEA